MEKKIDKSILIKILIVIIVVIGLFLVIKIESFTKMLNNIHNISGIGSKIDSVQIGDKINYSANGVEDWEVLSIDKGNNIIEIVSTDSVQNLTFKGYKGWLNAKSKMQKTADKYVEGPYAISARNLNVTDLRNSGNITKKGCFWLDEQSVSNSNVGTPNYYGNYYYCAGSSDAYSTSLINAYDFRTLIVVNLDDSNARNYNIGASYDYSSNGVKDWRILSIDSENSISIITSKEQYLDFATNNNLINGQELLQKQLSDYYDNDIVKSVRFVNESDGANLLKLGFTGEYLTGETGTQSYYTSENTYSDIVYEYIGYSYPYKTIYYSSWYNSYQTSSRTGYIYSYAYGFRPVVKLKYSEKLHEGKSFDTNLQVGDKVNYNGNNYSDWKVLNIDKNNGTAEIVSSNITKILTLRGLDNYNNFSNILQKEADEYLNGDNAISARLLSSSDIDDLSLIKDNCKQLYWLNDKKEYNYKNNVGTQCSSINYAGAVASYEDEASNIVRKWATLYSKYDEKFATNGCGSGIGTYDYAAGIRPVIKVKLANLSKNENPITTSKEIKVPENKQEAMTDSVAQEQTNPSLEDKENEWIIYESQEEKNNTNNNLVNKVSRKQYIPVIIISVISASIVSGLIVYYIIRKKYDNNLTNKSNKKSRKSKKGDDTI